MRKKIVIGFSLLVLVAVAAIGGWHFYTKAAKERLAVKNVNAQYAIANIEGDQIFQARISSLQELGIIGDKVAASKANICYLTAIEAGFITAEWAQICELHHVTGYSAPLPREETRARLQSLPKRDPTRHMRRFPRDDCRYDMLPFWRRGSLRWIPSGTTSEGSDSKYCGIPDLADLRGKANRALDSVSTTFDYTFDPRAVDRGSDQIWITYVHHYYRESLGCRGCLYPPRSTPIQAD
jgi:hypothetical protein